jgi:hypothetical protein
MCRAPDSESPAAANGRAKSQSLNQPHESTEVAKDTQAQPASFGIFTQAQSFVASFIAVTDSANVPSAAHLDEPAAAALQPARAAA